MRMFTDTRSLGCQSEEILFFRLTILIGRVPTQRMRMPDIDHAGFVRDGTLEKVYIHLSIVLSTCSECVLSPSDKTWGVLFSN